MLPRTFLWVPLLLFLPGMLCNAAPAGAESLFVGPPAVFPESPGLRAEAEELTRQEGASILTARLASGRASGGAPAPARRQE